MPGSQNTVTFPKGPLPPSYYAADRGHVLISVSITFIVVEAFAFAGWAVACRMRGRKLRWDDLLMVSALILNIAMSVMAIMSVILGGVGTHTLVAFFKNKKDVTFAHIDSLIVVPVLYAAALAASKGTILSLFLRIFTLGRTRWIVKGLAAVVFLHSFIAIFIVIFQCTPVSLTWTSLTRETCIDVAQVFKWTSLVNVITDIIMLLLPIPTIWSLKAAKTVKLGITLMLLLATMGIVASIVRLVGFFRDSAHIFGDPMWYANDLFAYTVAEPGTIFLAACFSQYKVLGRYMRDHGVFSGLTRWRVAYRRPGTSGWRDIEQGPSDDIKEKPSKGSNKPVRGFDSLVLSEIEREDSMSSK